MDIVCGAILVGVFSFVGYVLKAAHNMNRVADKLGTEIDNIGELSNVDISESVVNEAVYQAAKKKADDLARKASASAVNQVRDIIRTEVKSAVDKAYADVKKSVAEELRRQVADIDISDVKEEVVERAKDKAAEKFESALDGVLNNFNDNLQNVAKIYSSIAKTFSEKS